MHPLERKRLPVLDKERLLRNPPEGLIVVLSESLPIGGGGSSRPVGSDLNWFVILRYCRYTEFRYRVGY